MRRLDLAFGTTMSSEMSVSLVITSSMRQLTSSRRRWEINVSLADSIVRCFRVSTGPQLQEAAINVQAVVSTAAHDIHWQRGLKSLKGAMKVKKSWAVLWTLLPAAAHGVIQLIWAHWGLLHAMSALQVQVHFMVLHAWVWGLPTGQHFPHGDSK